jgi:hypothetical protein
LCAPDLARTARGAMPLHTAERSNLRMRTNLRMRLVRFAM